MSISGLAGALILQHFFKMEPCPYCVVQRMILCVIALTSILGLISSHTRSLSAIGAVTSAFGFMAAVGHTIKVTFPSNDESCAPGLGTWLDNLWTAELLPQLFAPVGDCLRDASTLFYLPLPLYAAGLFLGLTVMLVLNAINAKK